MCAPMLIPVLAGAAGYGGAVAAGVTGAQLAFATAAAVASGVSAGASMQSAIYNENLAKDVPPTNRLPSLVSRALSALLVPKINGKSAL